MKDSWTKEFEIDERFMDERFAREISRWYGTGPCARPTSGGKREQGKPCTGMASSILPNRKIFQETLEYLMIYLNI